LVSFGQVKPLPLDFGDLVVERKTLGRKEIKIFIKPDI
jgi:hypothetical protein